MFFVGQKVVCVDDKPRVELVRRTWCGFARPELLDHNLNRGDVYRVTAVQTALCKRSGASFTLLCLAEARHFAKPCIGFPSFQFRPLIDKKTSIAVFTAMLPPTETKPRIKPRETVTP